VKGKGFLTLRPDLACLIPNVFSQIRVLFRKRIEYFKKGDYLLMRKNGLFIFASECLS